MLLSTVKRSLRNRGRSFNLGIVLDLSDDRRQLKQKKYTRTEAGLEYRKVNREVRKKMEAAAEEWIESTVRT